VQDIQQKISADAQRRFQTSEAPQIVVSPYRFNPLGAHIDHQGGTVLARTLNQYSIGAYYPSGDTSVQIVSASLPEHAALNFQLGDAPTGPNWHRYAMASALAFWRWAGSQGLGVAGIKLVVQGTLIGAGLSSSASIILAYLAALADVNKLTLSPAVLVELCRQVENEHMGLNNGVQDQMSVVFGQQGALSSLNVDAVSVDYWANPSSVHEVSWLVCYSGFSRELITSGFNDRVSECAAAANRLSASAHRLGDVPHSARSEESIAALPRALAKRARHVYSEMQRVHDAQDIWLRGDWQGFGRLMNASCRSSIDDYECGSEPMHQLHETALTTGGVFGSRFSGGGYGGCLIMLVDSCQSEAIGEQVLQS